MLSQICYKEARPPIPSLNRKSNNFKPVEQKELRFNATQIDSKNDTYVPVSIFLYTWLQAHPNKGFEHDSYLKVFGDGGNVVLGKTRVENNFWKKLRPNFEFELHGRVFRIDGCDLKTNELLVKEGLGSMQVEKSEETIQKEQTEREQERIMREKEAAVKKQKDEILNKLSSSDIVFGFSAHLDTESKLNSSKRRLFKICYYVIDGTLEIREKFVPNSGYDPFPIFMRRKLVELEDRGCEKKSQKMHLSYENLIIGKPVRIMGNDFMLVDCDQATKNYYSQLGIKQEIINEQIEKLKVNNSCNITENDIQNGSYLSNPPRHSGPGDAEDSLQNCLHLRPKPIKKDLLRILENYNKTINVTATLIDDQAESSKNRIFVIKVHLEDDSISVYQQSVDSFTNTCFLKRSKVPLADKYDRKIYNGAQQPVFITLEDFRPNKDIRIFSRCFRVRALGEDFVQEIKKRQSLSEDEIEEIAHQIREQKSIQKHDSPNFNANRTETDLFNASKQVQMLRKRLASLIEGEEARLKDVLRLLGDENSIRLGQMHLLAETLNVPALDSKFVACLRQELCVETEEGVAEKDLVVEWRKVYDFIVE